MLAIELDWMVDVDSVMYSRPLWDQSFGSGWFGSMEAALAPRILCFSRPMTVAPRQEILMALTHDGLTQRVPLYPPHPENETSMWLPLSFVLDSRFSGMCLLADPGATVAHQLAWSKAGRQVSPNNETL